MRPNNAEMESNRIAKNTTQAGGENRQAGGETFATPPDKAFVAAYEELRRMARALQKRDPAARLSATTLVHEAWLKLRKQDGLDALPPLHFKRTVALAIRQILVDDARRRLAEKRGGAGAGSVSLEAGPEPAFWQDRNLVALDDALRELEAANARQASVVEARYFGGFDTAEIAALLRISEATVLRDWRAARAWLAVQMGQAAG
ncbi:MAG: ECF-type sigma factor [Bryobacter sp.]|nr:ECF-type sigma factor [Bryobacter sp.]